MDHVQLLCDKCGEPYQLNADGTTQHLTPTARVDHDADADHVPYGTCPECLEPLGSSAVMCDGIAVCSEGCRDEKKSRRAERKALSYEETAINWENYHD